jgi:hypothetical protein
MKNKVHLNDTDSLAKVATSLAGCQSLPFGILLKAQTRELLHGAADG